MSFRCSSLNLMPTLDNRDEVGFLCGKHESNGGEQLHFFRAGYGESLWNWVIPRRRPRIKVHRAYSFMLESASQFIAIREELWWFNYMLSGDGFWIRWGLVRVQEHLLCSRIGCGPSEVSLWIHKIVHIADNVPLFSRLHQTKTKRKEEFKSQSGLRLKALMPRLFKRTRKQQCESIKYRFSRLSPANLFIWSACKASGRAWERRKFKYEK